MRRTERMGTFVQEYTKVYNECSLQGYSLCRWELPSSLMAYLRFRLGLSYTGEDAKRSAPALFPAGSMKHPRDLPDRGGESVAWVIDSPVWTGESTPYGVQVADGKDVLFHGS